MLCRPPPLFFLAGVSCATNVGGYWPPLPAPRERREKRGKCSHKRLHSASRVHFSVFLFLFFLPAFPWLAARQRLMTLHSEGRALSLAPPSLRRLPFHLLYSRYKWRRSVFIVRRVARQPADGGLPWPWWTSGASFRSRRSLTRWLTALASRVHRAAAEVFCRVRSFVFNRQIFFFKTTSLRGVCCAVRIEKKVYRLGNRFECEAGFVEGGGPVRLAEVWIQRRVYFNEKRRCDVLVSVWESVIRSARRG